MARVVLQPSGSQGGREHYIDTIENLVDVASCAPFVAPPIQQALEVAHPSGKAGMWGVVGGKRNANVSKWDRVSVGDLVLFAADKKIKASATVATRFMSEPLANHLWKRNANNETWKYMYSLDEIKSLNISYEEFNKIVGYKHNNIIQGFTIMDEEKSGLFLDYFGLRSDRHIEEVDDAALEEALLNIDGPLDRKAAGWHRKEQSKARKRLLQGRTEGICQLCGRQMSAEFLVAAHIKRRSECDDREKRDFDGVMMLACRFGCDYLFELGLIAVKDNRLKISANLKDKVALSYISSRDGREVTINKKQVPYFLWHLVNRFSELRKVKQ